MCMNVYAVLFLSVFGLITMLTFFMALLYNFNELIESVRRCPRRVKYAIIGSAAAGLFTYYGLILVFSVNILNIILNKL